MGKFSLNCLNFLLILSILGGLGAQDAVVFDDEPSPVPAKPKLPNGIMNGNRPGFGNGFGNNGQNHGFENGFGNNGQNHGFENGFGNNGQNQGFGNGFGNNGQNQGFGNNGQHFGNGQGFGNNQNQGFGNNGQHFGNGQGFGNNQNQGFGNTPNQNFEHSQNAQIQAESEFLSSRQPDCQTYESHGGICTPLLNCDRIGRILRQRGPVAAARFLRRSLCGFTGVLPNVCCPLPRNQLPDNELGNGMPERTTTTPRPKTPTPPTPTTKNPFGGGGISLVPPTKQPVSEGGGLIIIQPTTPKSEPSSSVLNDVGLPPNCGFSNASHSRIVGGRTSEKGAWPWIAALGYRDDNSGQVNYLCGGALISEDFVITAAHCVHKKEDLTSVRLGDHDLFTNADGVVPLNAGVAEVIEHPQYEPGTFYNDIALIRLASPVPFSRQIHPICLPSSPSLRKNRFVGNTPFVAGWGAIQFNGPSSSVLREVQVPIVADSVCQEKFKSFKSVNVDDSNICAGFGSGGKDACQGDSGGPLMQPVGNNRYVLIGTVSFGFKCAEPGYPGVYARVTTHLDWIQRIIN